MGGIFGVWSLGVLCLVCVLGFGVVAVVLFAGLGVVCCFLFCGGCCCFRRVVILFGGWVWVGGLACVFVSWWGCYNMGFELIVGVVVFGFGYLCLCWRLVWGLGCMLYVVCFGVWVVGRLLGVVGFVLFVVFEVWVGWVFVGWGFVLWVL